MRNSVQYQLDKPQEFIEHFLEWSSDHRPVCLFNRNNFTAQNTAISAQKQGIRFDFMAGAEVLHELFVGEQENGFDALRDMVDTHNDWLLGYLTYDMKNHVEKLDSRNFDGVGFPLMHFFVPRYLFVLNGNVLEILFQNEYDSNTSVESLYADIVAIKPRKGKSSSLKVKQRIGRDEYLEKVGQLKQHIQRGDIYEVNFCQEFYAENATVDPERLYKELNAMSPAPFSAFYANRGKFLLCASPERYLRKIGRKIFSQPIKGTAARGKSEAADLEMRTALANDPKERTENVMIVDLVRNDLSRTAERNSVHVDELLGVYTFPQVHQLISTVSSELRHDLHFVEAIRNSFPMGSMTGAPKIRAMELIEEYEESKRGLFSGTVGYISPERDFDFNVVIRSMLYNEAAKYLSFTVGGAITIQSDPEKEYEECLLKATAMLKLLNHQPEVKSVD